MNKYLLFLGAWWFGIIRGFKNWKFVVAVSAHETGVWSSDLWKRASYGFGMRVPKVRTNVVDYETTNNYAGYRNGWRSVKDFYLWLDYNKYDYKAVQVADLVAFQKSKNYFGDTLENYTKGVQYHYENSIGILKNFFFVVNLVFIPTFILIIWKRKRILNYLRRITR